MKDLDFDLHAHLTESKDTALNATISLDFNENGEGILLSVITHYGSYRTTVHDYKELNEELGKILADAVQEMLN